MNSLTSGVQKTLRERVVLSGIGVHGGKPVTMALSPADTDTGIVFLRTTPRSADIEIPATSSSVTSTELCTVLGDPAVG
jgi:UDP-3-O-[3-hydroxymyristoyl] N-acetylglucosamine deacetylase